MISFKYINQAAERDGIDFLDGSSFQDCSLVKDVAILLWENLVCYSFHVRTEPPRP